MYNTEIRVANTATPSYQTTTNVGNFGWTGSDQGHYNQLIQYVEECRQIGVVVEGQARIIAEVVAEEEAIRGAIKYVADQTEYIGSVSESIKSDKADIETMVASIENKMGSFNRSYEDFINKYIDFLSKYNEIINKFP